MKKKLARGVVADNENMGFNSLQSWSWVVCVPITSSLETVAYNRY